MWRFKRGQLSRDMFKVFKLYYKKVDFYTSNLPIFKNCLIYVKQNSQDLTCRLFLPLCYRNVSRIMKRKQIYQSAPASLTKYHELTDLNSRHLFLTILEARIKALANLVPDEILFLAYGQPSSHCVLTQKKNKEHSDFLSLLISTPCLSQGIPNSGPHLNLYAHPKCPISKYHHIGNQGFNI